MSTNEMPLREARAQIGHLVDRAEHHGETTIITRHGRPAAMLVPYEENDVMANWEEAIFDVPALGDAAAPLSIGIAKRGGGTPGRDYREATWRYSVTWDGETVYTGERLETTVPTTHEGAARLLAGIIRSYVALGDDELHDYEKLGPRGREMATENVRRLAGWARG